MNNIVAQLFSLAISLLVAFLVWRFYRTRTFPQAEKFHTFGPRFWTGSVDSCILWPVGFVAVVLLSFTLPAVIAALVIIAQNLIWLYYTVHMHARYGQTYGKMVTKVRVVDAKTEGPLSFGQALLREGVPLVAALGIVGYEVYVLLTATNSASAQAAIIQGGIAHQKMFWLLAMLPGFWFLAEVITMLTNDKRRALHDFIAGTVVVRTNAS